MPGEILVAARPHPKAKGKDDIVYVGILESRMNQNVGQIHGSMADERGDHWSHSSKGMHRDIEKS